MLGKCKNTDCTLSHVFLKEKGLQVLRKKILGMQNVRFLISFSCYLCETFLVNISA